jgi:transglutaminase-like putative cysteine protease
LAEYGLRRHLSDAFTRARRAEKLATLGLLFVLLMAATAGVTSALKGPDWASLWRGLLFGLLVGWVLAIFRQPARRVAWIALAIGLIYTLLFVGGLAGKVLAAAAELFRLASHIATSPKGAGDDLTSLVHLLQELFASTGVIIERVQAWVMALVTSQPTFDPVAAALVWSLLVWIVAAWAGWVIEACRNALLAALPAILLSVGTLSYARRISTVLYLMLGVTLLLLATVQHDRREQGWDESGVAYPARKGRQIGNVAIIAATALVLFSVFASSISFQRIAAWVSEQRRPAAQQSGGLGKSLGIVPGSTSAPDVFEAVRRPGLPRDLLIKSGPELSERVVMTVAVEDLLSISQGGQPLPLYWRSFTYDVYTGRGWRSSETEQSIYQANQPLQSDHTPHHILIQQVVRPVGGGGGFVYAAGAPVTVNLQSEAAWRSPGDLFGIRIDSAVPYDARSLIPVADERTLRAAGQKYPDWVRQRFLALPPEVPGQVKALAIDLTASEPTPYDRARAIERYLRTIPYTLDVSRPPLDRDVVDFFLFDLRQGYCDYYASAMVVLARAAGVPARLAIGYASGTYNLKSKRFVVTEADAHSWVEVYFPNIGWVPFEPTAARPPLERSQRPRPEVPHGMASSEETPGVEQTKSMPWGWLLSLGGLALAGILGVVWAAWDGIRLHRLSEQAAAVEVYRRMRRYGTLLAVALEPGDTPYEFAASLSARLQELARQGVSPAFRLRLVREVHSIIDGIVHASYRPSQPQVAQDSHVLYQWQALRWRLRLMWILKSWESLRHRFQGRSAGVSGQSSAGLNRRSSRDGVQR